MRLGILGGTFDPPHLGHLAVAQDACTRLGLDRVSFVPAAQPPHKLDAVRTPPALRMEMTRAAIAGDERFDALDIELERDGPSYTADTMRVLAGRMPETELFLLLGTDQFRELASWREPEVIAAIATLVVVPRGGVAAADAIAEVRRAGLAVRATELDAVRMDVSSSDVRRRVARGEPIRYLVPDAVRAIIEREALYRSDRVVT